MVTTALLSATMGAAFIILPAFMLLTSAVYIVLRFRRAGAESIGLAKEWAVTKEALRDPVLTGTMLLLSGFIVVSFVTGDLDLSDYSGLVGDAFTAYGEALTDWDDPLSSTSISFKGGVLVVFMSAAVVAYALVGHFKTRWKMAEKAHATERLG
jgi:hypothetical protein